MRSIFSLKPLLVLCLLAASTWTQAQTITGSIKDSQSQEPLIGATVMVVNTSKGTVADIDGNFTLELPEGAESLTFSYVGYTPKTLAIDGQTTFNVLLDPKSLDEVIVIGYSTQKKSDKTGAVVNVGADELNLGRISDPIQAMQGKAAGVNISKQGGDPNAGFSVNIRGAAGLTSGTGPLYVVDGVPGVDPTTINPDDIESFNILKDASSAAIYGSRGANGVIIITTKGANAGSGKEVNNVEYSGFVSFDNVARRLDLLDSDEVRDFASRTGRTFIDNGANTDWQDEIFRTGVSQMHTLAFTGSDENSTYRASLSANNIEGVMKGSGKERYIGRLNLTQRTLNDRLTMQARISGTIESNDYVNYGNGTAPNNVLYQAYRRSPTDPVYNDDGSFFETDRSFQYFNPVAISEDIQNLREAKRFLGNFRTSLEIIDGLTASVNLAYIRDDDESFYFEPSFTASNTTEGLGRRSYNNKSSQLIETTINYVKTFNDKHNFNFIGGHSYQKDNFDGFSAEGKDAQSDFLTSNNLETLLQLEPGSITSYKNQSLLASFFGRVVYDFNKKYFATATLRRDGSSKFGKNNEWGWFPSGSVGWNIHAEDFMTDQDLLSQLKLRVGYGITGNQEIPINVDARFFIPAGTAINPENGETVLSFENANDVNPNPDLKWEENAELNIGLDFGLWKDRISGSVEYYNKTTRDLIYRYELPVPPNRNRFIYANAGEIANKGIEVTLQAYVLDDRNLDWKSVLTFARNVQETVALSNDQYDLDEIRTLYVSGRGLVGGENWTQLIAPGFEIGTFYMPEYAGLSEDGQFLFFTSTGGVTREVTQAERRVVGQAQPDFILGWSNYFTFMRNWDFSFAARAVVGHDILNVTRMVFSNPADLPTLNTLGEAVEEFDRGLEDNPTISDYYLEDGTFLKMDNIALGYTLDTKDSKHIKNLRFYVMGNNLFVLTNYSGVDPEVSFGGLEFGRDQYDVYPKTRSFTIGVNATF
ncbi:MAG: SusC/RagA family TonB-linked outer membrane protein [Flavobacteriales bacterium]|nr:SusC/RagA family TonB-linked outer membrane protein [Flavobacteriales bacterium]